MGGHHSTADFVGMCDPTKAVETVPKVSLPLGELPSMLVLRALVKQARESLYTVAFSKKHDCKWKTGGVKRV